MNNNINSTNFKGTFLLNYARTASGTREAFEKAIGKNGKIIFDNFGKEGDVLYVIKNSKDFAASNFIKINQIKFKYMPDMDTRLRFEPYFPEEVKKYISENKPKVITKMNEMLEYIKQNREKHKAIKNSHISFYDKILKNITHNVKGIKEKDCKGVVSIVDKANDGLIKISPRSKQGISYIYVKPSNAYDPTCRYAVDDEGNILAQYNNPNGIIKFNEHFMKAIRHHLHLD